MLYMLYEQYGAEGFHPVPISTVKDVVQYPHIRGFDALTWQKMLNIDTVHFYGVLAGHYDWILAKRLPDWQVVTMLRHPVYQLRSLYQYMAREKKENREVAEYLTAIGFAGWVQSSHIRPYLNGQTTYLSGHGVRNVDIALNNLQSERVTFGLVERFADSIQLFNHKFGWSLTEQQRNISPNVVDLEPDVYQEVGRLQANDMRLYTWATEYFEEQFQWQLQRSN